jgi:hypothetical protein
VPAAVTPVTAHPTLYCFALNAPSDDGGAVSSQLGAAELAALFFYRRGSSPLLARPSGPSTVVSLHFPLALTRLAQRWRSHELPPKDLKRQPKHAEVDDNPD